MNRIVAAPLMKFSTPFFRHLLHDMCPSLSVYTEMVMDQAIIYSDNVKLMHFLGPYQANTVVQLASNTPGNFIAAVRKIIDYDDRFNEFNLNCGCPSEKLKNAYGAALMAYPDVIASIIAAAKREFPERKFTIKCRIGLDEVDSYESFEAFIDRVASADPKLHFIVHARKAWLNGVNPRENRRVPPLMYDYVYKISKARPSLEFTLNGGLNTVPIVKQVLEEFPGKIMIGRAFYDNPLFIYDLLQDFSPDLLNGLSKEVFRKTVLTNYFDYLKSLEGSLLSSRIPPLVTPLRDIYYGETLSGYYRRRLCIDIMNGITRPKTPTDLADRLRILSENIDSITTSTF